MTRWNAPFGVEQIKQLTLIARLSPHHGRPPPLDASSTRNHCSPKIANPFSTLSAISGSRLGSTRLIAERFSSTINFKINAIEVSSFAQ
jgi:hypothetical protein